MAALTPHEKLAAKTSAIYDQVEKATVVPKLTLVGCDIYNLHQLHEELGNLRDYLSGVAEKGGAFGLSENGIRYAKQPGAIMDTLSKWANEQVERCVEAIESVNPKSEMEQSFRLEVLLPHYLFREEWQKVAALLASVLPAPAVVHRVPVGARDRLDDGINLLHTVWLAMAGDTMDPGAFAQDRQAVVDTIWQGLRKLEEAKAQLAATAEGKPA